VSEEREIVRPAWDSRWCR